MGTESTEEHTNARKRHYPYVTTAHSSKKLKDDGCSIYGEVITPHPAQNCNFLLSPIDAATRNPNYGKVWIDILEEPKEVNKIIFRINDNSPVTAKASQELIVNLHKSHIAS